MPSLFGDTQLQVNTSGAGQSVVTRTLLPWSVDPSASNRTWVVTLQTNQKAMGGKKSKAAAKCVRSFSLPSEKQAYCIAKSWAPPIMYPFRQNPYCHICKTKFAIFRRPCHCRNCGVCICQDCAVNWPARMVPDTYNIKKENMIKACKSCEWLCNAFRLALLEGRMSDAVALHGTGNVNITMPFANIKVEEFFPVHCAVLGGNLELLCWLVDDHCSPVKSFVLANRCTPVVTSKGRSLLGVAMEKANAEILHYLVVKKDLSLIGEKGITTGVLIKALDKVLRTTTCPGLGGPEACRALVVHSEKRVISVAESSARPRTQPFGENPSCHICKKKFGLFRRPCHCRNCGVCVCKDCSVQWPARMIPEAYNIKLENMPNVCKNCERLCNTFRLTLLEGRMEEAVALHGTGKVHLMMPFANVKGEELFPVHCAVLGGNLELLRWLVDEHCSPIKTVRASAKVANKYTPILTSKGRSLLGIAMQNANVEIVRYLVVNKELSIAGEKDITAGMLITTLDKALRIEGLCIIPHTVSRSDSASYNDSDAESTSFSGNKLDSTSHSDNKWGSLSPSDKLAVKTKVEVAVVRREGGLPDCREGGLPPPCTPRSLGCVEGNYGPPLPSAPDRREGELPPPCAPGSLGCVKGSYGPPLPSAPEPSVFDQDDYESPPPAAPESSDCGDGDYAPPPPGAPTFSSDSELCDPSDDSDPSDECRICFEGKIECVAIPCGHQMCCMNCSSKISRCPFCSQACSFVRVFKP